MFDKLADKKIREAMREGEFENLQGAGKPLDLEDYFKAPEDLRMAYGLLKSANVVPEEVELLNEIVRLEGQAEAETVPKTREALHLKVQDLRLQLSVKLEQRRKHR